MMEKCHAVDEAQASDFQELANSASYLTYPAVQIFGGLLESRTRCNHKACGRQTRQLEVITHVQVGVPRGPSVTLDVALTTAQGWERLHRSPCPSCKRDLRSKRLVVERWPSCLLIQVRRWKKGACGVRWVKDQQHLSFEPTLSRGPVNYTLKAVVCHSGLATNGHYICYACPMGDWYRCDDTHVDPCLWEDVLRSQAYMLFYDSE